MFIVKKVKKKNIEEIKSFEKNKENNVIDIIISVNMFNEGLHIHGVTGVILLRETQSRIVYFQQIGRVINQDNEVPIVFDFVNNYNSVEEGYLQIFSDYVFENCQDKNNKANNSYFNKDGYLIDKLGNVLTTENGEVINIHDETKNIMDIINQIVMKTNIRSVYNSLLNENYEWLKKNAKECSIEQIQKHIPFTYSEDFDIPNKDYKIPKEYIREWLKKHNIQWRKYGNIKRFDKKILDDLQKINYTMMTFEEIWRFLFDKYKMKLYKTFSTNAFKKFLEKNHIEYKESNNQLSEEEKNMVDDLFYKGIQPVPIAKAIGRDRIIIERYIREKRKKIVENNQDKSLDDLSKLLMYSKASTISFCNENHLKYYLSESKQTNKNFKITLNRANILKSKLDEGKSLIEISNFFNCDVKDILSFALEHYLNFKINKELLQFSPNFEQKQYKNVLIKLSGIKDIETKSLEEIGKETRFSSLLYNLARWRQFPYNHHTTLSFYDKTIIKENFWEDSNKIALILNKDKDVISKYKEEFKKECIYNIIIDASNNNWEYTIFNKFKMDECEFKTFCENNNLTKAVIYRQNLEKCFQQKLDNSMKSFKL